MQYDGINILLKCIILVYNANRKKALFFTININKKNLQMTYEVNKVYMC